MWPLDGDIQWVLILHRLSSCRQLYKDRLNIPIKAMLGYQSHDDTSSKSGSTTKNMYSVWTRLLPLTRCRFKQLPKCIFTITWVFNYCRVVSFSFLKDVLIILSPVWAPPLAKHEKIRQNRKISGSRFCIWAKMREVFAFILGLCDWCQQQPSSLEEKAFFLSFAVLTWLMSQTCTRPLFSLVFWFSFFSLWYRLVLANNNVSHLIGQDGWQLPQNKILM